MESNEYEDYTGMTHGRWWAHHKCSSTKYRKAVKVGSSTFAEKKYKLYVKGFRVDGLRYKAFGATGAQLVGVSSAAKKRATSLVIPATVTYKGNTYKVVSIGAAAFAKAKAKTLVLETPSLKTARITGCLTNSKVKTIRLSNAARRKKTTYKKAFTKENTGAKKAPKIK